MSEPDTIKPEKPKKDWNAMIYLAGENNLAEECVFALKELKRARPRRKKNNDNEVSDKEVDKKADARVKVVAQLDAGGLGGNEVRYLLTRGDEDGILAKNAVSKVDTTETSYRGVLKDFIYSSIGKDGRADHYLLVLSGHGNGVISDFLSRDVETYDKLSIPKIQWVLREVKQDLTEKLDKKTGEDFKIDVLGLDSCMMSMAEIGYELRNYVSFMVGAEGFEPNAGWPYERILSDMLTDPDINPEELAVKIVQRYANYYKDFLPAGRSVDQSACNLNKCKDLASAIRELADILYERILDPETMRHIVLAHWEAQSYKDDQYVDLYDFCDLLDRGPSENPENPVTGSRVMRGLVIDKDTDKDKDRIRPVCRKIKKILTGNGKNGEDSGDTEPMVLRTRHSGPAVQYSHGLSMYFPWSKVVDSYKDLEFANDTNWRKFLLRYTELTRRARRPCPSGMVEAEVVTGELFFNPVVAGFDYLWTDNKNAPTVNRVLSNKVGGMKNPAIDYGICKPSVKKDSEPKAAAKRKPKKARAPRRAPKK